MKSFAIFVLLLAAVSIPVTASVGVQIAYGQPSEGIVESTSEQYSSPEYGVGMTFPTGWKRLHIPDNRTVVEVATSSMTDERSISELMKNPSIFLIINEQNATSSSSPSFGNSAECNTIFKKYRLVSGVPAIESTVHCQIDTYSVNIKSITINAGTRWIVLMYSSPSSRFDDHLAEFEVSVGTLTVTNPNLWFLTINGTNVPIIINSSSIITDLGIDSQDKRIFFKTEGGISSNVMTTLTIGKILEGPYAVAVDDQSSDRFRIVQGESATETNIEILHSQGSHIVEIVGTNVIPEFPSSTLAIFGTLVAAPLATRVFKMFKALFG